LHSDGTLGTKLDSLYEHHLLGNLDPQDVGRTLQGLHEMHGPLPVSHVAMFNHELIDSGALTDEEWAALLEDPVA